MCAIGRYLISPGKIGVVVTSNIVPVEYIFKLDSLLKEEYRGHAVSFWKELQIFHDLSEHWDDKGITQEGKNYAESLKLTYRN